MGFRVIIPGPLTTVQDAGRTGYQSQGFPAGGAMDLRALRLGNLLTDNAENEAALEFAFSGPELEFTAPAFIAVTGGDAQPRVNGKSVPMNTALRVRKGDRLHFGGMRQGMYGYIAFAGGLDIPPVMGCRSTSLACGIGGFQGRKLAAGDEIRERTPCTRLHHLRARTVPQTGAESSAFRVIMGPQNGMFTLRGTEIFLTSEYTVTEETNRMGCRLEGPSVPAKHTSDIISDGIAPGAIQISSDGKPIILMSDRQTTGGYAKIATVITADLPRLAQTRPGTRIRFQAVTLQEAQAMIRQERQDMDDLRERFRHPWRRKQCREGNQDDIR